MIEQITFWALALLTVGPAVMVVTARNIFHAGLWLLPTLMGVAGFYLVLGSDFLSAIQVLIYVGGIMVLLLFAVLMTRRIADPETRVRNRQTGWALLCGAAVAALLIVAMKKEFGGVLAISQAPAGTAENMGGALLGAYLLPFEIASVLLLAAVVGAIVLARGEK